MSFFSSFNVIVVVMDFSSLDTDFPLYRVQRAPPSVVVFHTVPNAVLSFATPYKENVYINKKFDPKPSLDGS